ncbi:MAG TPA: carbohydrate binding domain-containing protein, partial [Blastocatellia bacterium]|nr:carbohydrate binding domain-containing protein [Blastocatellia bacterium]
MFHCTSRSSSSHTQRRVRMIWAIGIGLFLVGLAYSPALLNPRPAIAQTGSLIRNDFEDGTLQGWIPRGGGVVLTNSTEVAQSGTHSLKTAGRTAGFHGPSLDLLGRVLKGGTYQISASVRLVAGQPASQLRATMQRTLADGTNQFDQVAASAANGVTDAAWVTLQGQYSFGADVNGLLLYIESADPTSSYYVDDFSITILVPPPNGPQDNSGIATDFETNSAEGWQPRIGRETLTATAADQHGGSYSLLTTGRQREFDGAMIDVTNKMYIGSQYRISVWVKLAPGEAPIAARVSLQRTLGTATSFHTVVGNTQVTADQWVLLTAVYNYAFNHSALSLYVETEGTTPVRAPSLYIDDFALTYIPPPEIEQNIPSVFGTLADYFHVGSAIEQTEITGVHGDLLKKHF